MKSFYRCRLPFYDMQYVAFLSRWTKFTRNSQLEGFLFFLIYCLQCYLSLIRDVSFFKVFEVADVEEDLCLHLIDDNDFFLCFFLFFLFCFRL